MIAFNNFRLASIVTLVLFISYPLIFSSCGENQSSSSSATINYYFNAVTGKDANNGTSQNTAWKSFSKINSIKLKPGDSVLLANNVVFEQPLLLENIVGTSVNKIVFSSYSPTSSTENKRAIISTKNVLNAVSIIDCSFIEITNLEISAKASLTNPTSTSSQMRCGILVKPKRNGTSENITFDNLIIQDVFYEKPEFTRPSGEVKSANGTQNYGWGIRIINANENALIKGVFIKNCLVKNVAHTGIKFTGKNRNIKNILVENCEVIETGGPGIQMSGIEKGHILNNYVNKSGSDNDSRKWGRGSGLWTWGSSDILIEKNHFLNANGPGDSAGAHIDYNCENIILQYNFSANNAGGFCEILGNNYNCAYRYNISVNDGHRVKGIDGAFQEGKTLWLSGYVGDSKRNGPFNSYIYNNTIVVSKDILSKFAFDKASSGVLIMNNIFYIQGESAGVLGDQYNPEKEGVANITNVLFENNLFLKNNWPENIPIKDIAPIIGNPEFVNVGGMNIEDYRPKNTTLIRNKGKEIKQIPNDDIGLKIDLKVTHDILGNPIKNNPDFGAIEISSNKD